MRSISIEVPPAGITLVIKPEVGAKVAKAILVVDERTVVHLAESETRSKAKTEKPTSPAPQRAQPVRPAPIPIKTPGAKSEFSLQEIAQRLKKLKVKKKASILNAIKAMFQFTSPMDDVGAEAKLKAILKAGFAKPAMKAGEYEIVA